MQILIALAERVLISFLIYQVDKLEKKLEKKRLDLAKRLPEHRHKEARK